STLSVTASAISSGVVVGNSPFPATVSAKIGRTNSVHPGQMAGATEPLRGQYARHKCPVQAGGAVDTDTGSPEVPAEFPDVRTGKIWMGEENGAINQADPDFRPAARPIHQCREFYNIQRTHNSRFSRCPTPEIVPDVTQDFRLGFPTELIVHQTSS